MRAKIYNNFFNDNIDSKVKHFYDFFMIVVIVLSLVPLLFKETLPIFIIIDKITVSIFIVDYVLRLFTADYKFSNKGIIPFIRYPFSFMAVIDLLSILPSLIVINSGFKALRILRMLRAMRVFRVLKVIRYSKDIAILISVIKKSKDALITVGLFALGYIFVSALVVFNVEPETFNSFLDAIYWATVSLTTVGYGDIYPITAAGRFITMISSLFGIAIVALPAGIVTAGYMETISEKNQDK